MRQIKCFLIAVIAFCACLVPIASAQVGQSATGQRTSAPPQENKIGGYVAAGDIEAGYRFSDVKGASFGCGTPGGICNYQGMWYTLENLRQGPRLFEQSLSLRADPGTGVLFDNLYESTFGWGGDPENVARLRVSKRKVYNLTVQFRRDYSLYDFNLLANPLNPSTSLPNPGNSVATSAQLISPHQMNAVRRMSDVALQLAPQSKISVRLGYNRVRYENKNDFTFTTFHMPRGTDIAPNLFYNYTNQQFRAGIDLKFIPRTTISFDGIVNRYKNDTNAALLNFPVTIGGIPANEGISWNTQAGQPCAPANLGTVRCNQGNSFLRADRYRSTMPTIMASLESHYWQRLDLTAHATYGWSDMSGAYLQSWTGLSGGTGVAQSIANNPITNRRLTSNVDLGATYHLTDHVRISDTFRFVNQRYPIFGINLTNTTPGTTASTPSGPSVATAAGQLEGLFLDTKLNETMFEFDVGKHAGVNVGYRYTRRLITFSGQGFDVDPVTGERSIPTEAETGFDRFEIPQHSAIGSAWFQPSSKFRFNADAELSSAGINFRTVDPTTTPATDFSINGLTTFTRITPRHEQQYRARATFEPMRHVAMTGALNIWEQRNTLSNIEYRFHNRNYGFTATVTPNDRIMVDFAYNYQDILQNALICFVASGTPAAGSFPGTVVSSAGACPLVAAPYLGTGGDYTDQTHFGSIMLRVKPVKRATLSAGYSIVSTDGNYTVLDALQPLTPTKFDYIRPLAAVEIDLLHGLALKGSYNYYDYNEHGSSADVFGSGGPTFPRDFHAHVGTLALRYSF